MNNSILFHHKTREAHYSFQALHHSMIKCIFILKKDKIMKSNNSDIIHNNHQRLYDN